MEPADLKTCDVGKVKEKLTWAIWAGGLIGIHIAHTPCCLFAKGEAFRVGELGACRERWHVKGLQNDQPLLKALHQGRGLQGPAGGKQPIPSTMVGRKRPLVTTAPEDHSRFSFGAPNTSLAHRRGVVSSSA